MAERDPIHGSDRGKGELDAFSRPPSLPLLSQRLLPYERQLIGALGCTEQEYLEFKQQVAFMSRERPAEYAHIPEVNNDGGLTAVVLFVVGLVLQGVSYLLTPKPNLPQQSRQQANRQLDSIAGRDRFAPTYGFQSAQELSRYNEIIPIVFTRHIPGVQLGGGAEKVNIGGVMISPKLVWSRTFSWGSYQSIEMVFLAGQGPMSRPSNVAEDRSGIYVGQTPIDTLLDLDYAWYFNDGGKPNDTLPGYAPSSSRLQIKNKRSGAYEEEKTGGDDNAFKAMTLSGLTSQAFSHTFSPSTQARFGVYNALPNGTTYRLNFEVISHPRGEGTANVQKAASARLAQLTGTPTWAGTGRNYGRQFGIVKYKGQEVPALGNNNGIRKTVAVGDTVEVVYNAAKVTEKVEYNKAFFHPTRVNIPGTKETDQFALPDEDAVDNKSIQQAIKTEHEQQDDLLKLGSRWLIGNALWEVTKRTPEGKIYDRSDETKYTVVLTCRATYDREGYVGICDYKDVTTVTHMPENINGPVRDIDSAWFPLCKADLAVIQNSRKCEVTEIGLKSNVWARLNGICNFSTLISPAEKYKYDKIDVPVTAGTTQAYMRRASFFYLYVRPANNSSGPNEGWERLTDYPFCVVGSTPQDQYNYIRISQPFDQFEYRFRPISSGELIHVYGGLKDVQVEGKTVKGPCIRLNIDGGADLNPWVGEEKNRYGLFTIRVRGSISSIAALALNPEMVSDVKTTTAQTIVSPLDSVKLLNVRLENGTEPAKRIISNGITNTIQLDPDQQKKSYSNIPIWPGAAGDKWQTAIYSFTDEDKLDFRYVNPANASQWITMNIKLGVYKETTTKPPERVLFWYIANAGEIPALFKGGNWKGGDRFTITKLLLDNKTKIHYNFEINHPTKIDIPPQVSGSRVFEPHAGIAEVSHYGSLITRSCDNGPEHEVVYVNESLANDASVNRPASYTGCAMAGLKLRSGPNLDRVEQLHVYQKEGVQVKRFRHDGITFGPSNVFTDLVYYLLTDKNTGLGEFISPELIDVDQLKRTGSFLAANNLRYDDVIVEPVNLREFFARISTSLLCNLVTRAGKFSIEPALPIDEKRNYTIYDVPVPISGIFTEGNIIEGSFQLEYIPAQERLPIRALVRYREESPNRFPQEKTVVVYRKDEPNGPLEEFSFTHITSQYHAELFAKYALSSRFHRTHAVTFKTTPYGLSLAPGEFIRVVTQSGYTNTERTGIIDSKGRIITSSKPLAKAPNSNQYATFEAYIWNKSQENVTKVVIDPVLGSQMPGSDHPEVAFTQNTAHWNSIFAEVNTSVNNRVYMVDSLDLDEEGLVQITASYFPVNSQGESLIAEDLKPTSDKFVVISDVGLQ